MLASLGGSWRLCCGLAGLGWASWAGGLGAPTPSTQNPSVGPPPHPPTFFLPPLTPLGAPQSFQLYTSNRTCTQLASNSASAMPPEATPPPPLDPLPPLPGTPPHPHYPFQPPRYPWRSGHALAIKLIKPGYSIPTRTQITLQAAVAKFACLEQADHDPSSP